MTERQIVGVLELASKYKYGLTSRGTPLFLFRPYDEAEPEYIVGSNERDLTQNRIAVVGVTTPVPDPDTVCTLQTKPRGSLQRLIGYVGEPVAECKGLLLHYCPTKPAVVTSVMADTTDDEKRIDLSEATGWITFHIDPPGCRDIDDAIAYHPETKRWAITIADASALVASGSEADVTAKQIGSTFYDLEGRAIKPMLPATISEEAGSLQPGHRRRGVSLLISDTGSEDFALSWITVKHSCTYDSFPGSLVDRSLPPREETDPHEWIASLMIRYNKAVAARLKAASVGLLRVQPAGEAPTYAAAANPDLASLGQEAARYEVANNYKEQNHASLGLTAYCHASSPLRRYADLANQRILKQLLAGTPITNDYEIAAALNRRTQANRRWTRDLTFLTHVTPGRVHEIDVVWLTETHVWVPTWRRLLRIRHEEVHPAGTEVKIEIYCDPTRRNWKNRVLTARSSTLNGPA